VLLGVDVGTTNVKAAAYGVDGRLQTVATQRLAATQPRPGWSEYEPEQLFAAAASTMRRALAALDDPPVAGVAVASMAETAVPVDAAGEPLFQAIAWHDERTWEQADWWRREVGTEAVYRVTGLPIMPIFGVHKLMWLRRHEPQTYARIRAWLNVADYVAYRLCGVQATDLSLASRLMLLDLRTRRWSSALLDACGIDPRVLPELVESGTRLGSVHRTAALATGLPEGTPVAAGGHDHPCGALALGLTQAGDLLDSMGTAESLLTVVAAPLLTNEMASSGYQQGAHVAAGMTYVNGGLYTSGACVEWLRSLIAVDEVDPYAALAAWAATSPVGSHGVFFLPHLRLPSPPVVAIDARAAFVGLGAGTERADLARALLEGLAFEAQASLEGLLRRSGLTLRRVRAIGGGSRNRLLMRIKAALLGARIEIASDDEATTLGAALLAGVAAGVYRDTLEAPQRLELAFDAVDVDPDWRERYLRAYHDVYLQLYPRLEGLHRAIRALEGADAGETSTA
jgi:xylulokinase